MNRTYPYKAWVILPAGGLREIELVKNAGIWSDGDWDEIESGKLYHIQDLYPTRGAAIAKGLAKLVEQEAAVRKRLAAIDKKRAALQRAAA